MSIHANTSYAGSTEWNIANGNLDFLLRVLADQPPRELSQDWLSQAVNSGRPEFIEEFLKHPAGKALIKSDARILTNLLHEAINAKQPEMVRLLLRYGAPLEGILDTILRPRMSDHLPWTALAAAVNAGSVEMVKLLIEAGAETELALAGSGKGWNASVKENPFTGLEHDFRPHLLFALAVRVNQPEVVSYLYRRIPALRPDTRARYAKTAQSLGLFITTRAMVDTLSDLGIPLNGDDTAAAGGKGGDGKRSDHNLLEEAVRRRDMDFVSYLLDEKKYRLRSEGVTELFVPVLSGDIALLTRLLAHQKALDPTWFTKAGKGINAHAGKKGNTALIEAIDFKYSDMALLLLEYGADLHATGEDGETALVKAVSEGLIPVAKQLLAHGADPQTTYYSENRHAHYPVLVLAVAHGYFEIANMLIAAGAKVDFVDRDGGTLLHEAAKNAQKNKPGGVAFVRELLRRGLSVTALNRDGETPLAEAIWGGNGEVVTLLCQSGSDIGHRVKDKSLLKLALDHDRPDAARALLARGARDPAISPLTLAVLTGDLENVMKQATVSKDDLNTALVYAVRSKRDGEARKLLTQGADPNTPDTRESSSGPTPLLYHAIQDKNVALAKALVAHGANPSAEFAYLPKNLLAYAIQQEQPAIVRLLLERGARQVREQLPYFAYEQPSLLAEALRLSSLDPYTRSEDARELATLLELNAGSAQRDKHIHKLLDQHVKSPNAGLARLARTLVAEADIGKILADHAMQKMRVADVAHMNALVAFAPSPGSYELWEPSKEVPAIQGRAVLELALEYRFRGRRIEETVRWLLDRKQSELALRFLTTYKPDWQVQNARDVLEAARGSAEYLQIAAALPTLDRCLVIKIAAASHNVAALQKLAKDIDPRDCLLANGIDHYYRGIQKAYPEGLLAVAVNDDTRSDATVAAILAIQPQPPDIALAVHRALEFNRFDVLKRLHRAGLLQAVDQFNLDDRMPGYTYLRLLRAGAGDKAVAQDLLVALILRGRRQDVDLLDEMVRRGAQVNMPDSQGRHALDMANIGGPLAMDWLARHGADARPVMAERGGGWITRGPELAQVKQLLANAKDSAQFKESALINAARHGQLDVVEYLLEQGATGKVTVVDLAQGMEFGALEFASLTGRTLIVERILQRSPPNLGRRAQALKYAIDEGHYYCARALLDGVDLARLTIDMKPARDYARAQNRNSRIESLFR